jgi:phosphatidylserine/phosphatidylglycerophosphate/cardiolipin synthase-like enzyme
MTTEFQVSGKNPAAKFSLKIHRGDGMALLAMNWKPASATPPDDFVGFAIEYREPGAKKFIPVKNRLSFDKPPTTTNDKPNPRQFPTLESPLQKFRWVHFPPNAEKTGAFRYRVTPVFMNDKDELSYGEAQEADIELARETYPNQLNVTFTRGYVSSQAFADRYGASTFPTLIPSKADEGLDFEPTHPKADEAYEWMGFEARSAILGVLDEAIADKTAKVRVIAYDLNQPEIFARLKKLKKRLRIIVDNSGTHGKPDSPETEAAAALAESAGKDNVKRQKMGQLQHNKVIIVESANTKRVVCGSTNFSWRGLYVQSNNAIVLTGAKPVGVFGQAFEDFWTNEKMFRSTASANWQSLGLKDINAKVSFSPHSDDNTALADIGADIKSAKSSVLYSLAFLAQTGGDVTDALKDVTADPDIFVYGVADDPVGLELQKPDGTKVSVPAAALSKNVPEPFKSEAKGGSGVKMHHKFVVIDFDKPTARVYMGSYNFSNTADGSNGENLLLIKDRRVAVSYMIEALRIFDAYHFRSSVEDADKKAEPLLLKRPPRKAGEKPWWKKDYTDAVKIMDRKLFA